MSLILQSRYPAKTHARKVADVLRNGRTHDNAILYLEGQKTHMLEDNDSERPFRQRRPFFYLSGCAVPDCSLTYDVAKDHLALAIPPLSAESVVWSGLPLVPSEAMLKYDIDECITTDELPNHLSRLSKGPNAFIYAIKDRFDKEKLKAAFAEQHASTPAAPHIDVDKLGPAIDLCRVVKDDYELALIRHANEVSTAAHTAVLRAVGAGVKNEYELEAVFTERCIALGCHEQPYHGIFASGTNAATLHYVRNDEPVSGRLNVLVDAAAESSCYAADVTRTYPLDGVKGFTRESRDIYNIVANMQQRCLETLRAGVVWDEVHKLAHRVAVEGLLRLGILLAPADAKDPVAEILAARTSVAFFPHGLGHYLGMDTHDVGGNANYSDTDPMFRYLRVRGKVPAGSVITVEPGVYFCRFIIEPYLKDKTHSKYIDAAVLEDYWDVGGVRIEDDVLVTENGYENLTTAVKDVDEMQKIINSA